MSPSELQKLAKRQALKRSVLEQANKLSGDNRANNLLENKTTFLELTTPLSVTNNTYTLVGWDTATLDTDGWHSAATPSRITVTYAGLYMALIGQSWDSSNATGLSYLSLYKNGVRAPEGNPAQAAIDTNRRTFSTIAIMASAGDYFETYAWQNSGGTRTLGSGTSSGLGFTNHKPYFAIVKII